MCIFIGLMRGLYINGTIDASYCFVSDYVVHVVFLGTRASDKLFYIFYHFIPYRIALKGREVLHGLMLFYFTDILGDKGCRIILVSVILFKFVLFSGGLVLSGLHLYCIFLGDKGLRKSECLVCLFLGDKGLRKSE